MSETSDNVDIVSIDGKEYWVVGGLEGTGGISFTTEVENEENESVIREELTRTGSNVVWIILLSFLLTIPCGKRCLVIRFK